MKCKFAIIACLVLIIAAFGCEKKDNKVVDNKAVDSKAIDDKAVDNELENVVISYCKLVENGKFDEASSYLTSSSMLELKRTGKKSPLEPSTEDFKIRKGLKSIQITKKTADNTSAMIIFNYLFNDGSIGGDTLKLEKENGKWKITK